MLTICYPKQFKASSLHSVWAQFSGLESGGLPQKSVLLDASQIEYLDAEGANYLALLPRLASMAVEEVGVRLPLKENVLSFLESLGVLAYLEENFRIEPGERTHTVPPRYLLDRHGSALRFAAPFQTYILESDALPTVFRHEVIRYRLFSLDRAVAQSVCCCIFELAHNIFDHSRTASGCLTIQFRRGTRDPVVGQLFVAVSDLGIGIRRSLIEHAETELGIPAGANDEFCLRWALGRGHSRFGPGVSRGLGLWQVARLANVVHFSSGECSVYLNRTRRIEQVQKLDALPGTSLLLIFDIERGDGKAAHRFVDQ